MIERCRCAGRKRFSTEGAARQRALGYTLGNQVPQNALRARPHGATVSEQQDPRKQQDSNLAVAIAGVVAIGATIAVLYISGMFN